MGDTDFRYQPVLNRPDPEKFSPGPHKLCGCKRTRIDVRVLVRLHGVYTYIYAVYLKSVMCECSLPLFLSPVQSLLVQILPVYNSRF